MRQNRMTVPLAELRATRAGSGHRLRLLDYSLPADRLPNGRPRPSRVVGEGVLRLGGDFHLLVRVLRPEIGPMLLEVLDQYDTAAERQVVMTLDAGLLRGVYDLLGQAHVAAKARRHGRSAAGRN